MTKYVEYLDGGKFDNYAKISFENKRKIYSRQELLSNLVKYKKVIHVGCVDHSQIVMEKIKSGEWMHKALDDAASTCIGLDINKEGIDLVKSLWYSEVILHDVISDEPTPVILNQKWDYIVLDEILEHINNPVAFLYAIKQKHAGAINGIIITVPNAFYTVNFRNIFKNMKKLILVIDIGLLLIRLPRFYRNLELLLIGFIHACFKNLFAGDLSASKCLDVSSFSGCSSYDWFILIIQRHCSPSGICLRPV